MRLHLHLNLECINLASWLELTNRLPDGGNGLGRKTELETLIRMLVSLYH